jgi:hypothetical protein
MKRLLFGLTLAFVYVLLFGLIAGPAQAQILDTGVNADLDTNLGGTGVSVDSGNTTDQTLGGGGVVGDVDSTTGATAPVPVTGTVSINDNVAVGDLVNEDVCINAALNQQPGSCTGTTAGDSPAGVPIVNDTDATIEAGAPLPANAGALLEADVIVDNLADLGICAALGVNQAAGTCDAAAPGGDTGVLGDGDVGAPGDGDGGVLGSGAGGELGDGLGGGLGDGLGGGLGDAVPVAAGLPADGAAGVAQTPSADSASGADASVDAGAGAGAASDASGAGAAGVDASVTAEASAAAPQGMLPDTGGASLLTQLAAGVALLFGVAMAYTAKFARTQSTRLIQRS